MQALATDAYKFSMAQAGFPLREETFYFSFRSGGCQFVPLDLAAQVRKLVDDIRHTVATDAADLEFLAATGYPMSHAMQDALRGEVSITAVPKDCWVFEREPILTVTGPSFLVSFLEPQLIWLNYPIQIATAAKKRLRGASTEDSGFGVATCEAHRQLILETLDPILGRQPNITVDSEGYHQRVQQQVEDLVSAVGGDANRIFEVGMRSAVCMDQHRIALNACKAAGVHKTSNVLLARELDMHPVGTMGHEHVQRWGSDLHAFRSMRDMRHGMPSYLLDTFDTVRSGLPTAVRVMQERPHHSAIRYDSGNKVTQYLIACEMFKEAGLSPTHIIEDGLDLAVTKHFEELRAFTSLPIEQQHYGYGGHIVAEPADCPHTRDRVSAVYKLSETSGEPRMKFGNEAGLGKISLPGRPVIWRRLRGDGPVGIIAQEGEEVAPGCICLSGNEQARDPLQAHTPQMLEHAATNSPFTLSDETKKLMNILERRRN